MSESTAPPERCSTCDVDLTDTFVYVGGEGPYCVDCGNRKCNPPRPLIDEDRRKLEADREEADRLVHVGNLRLDRRFRVAEMLRRDLRREPTEREVSTWLETMSRNGCFTPDPDGR